ncbi:hypothetical protein HPC37_07395 [Pasteurellaceae bacterium 20609_3]|uniref:hypothetical protein n=1 Tax=Spirabiliibacterium mucosae TaxID=28156 RepID=UPI001AAC5B65|nr:hypothetical protein [Spirabiliibacterium mucosae]MBE2898626.1 hypothetical protein [Spirabiliibacterium mucosae]
MSGATLVVKNASFEPVLRIGKVSKASYQVRKKTFNLPSIENLSANNEEYPTQGIGVQLRDVKESIITFETIIGFGVGIDVGGEFSGFGYNQLFPKAILNNRINMRFFPKGESGWCNQNTIIGGRFAHVIQTNNISGVTQILMKPYSESSDISGGNNNTFLGCSLESIKSEYVVNFDGAASDNLFLNCRYENYGDLKVRLKSHKRGSVHGNLFIGGHSLYSIKFLYEGDKSSYNGLISSMNMKIAGLQEGICINNTTSDNVNYGHITGYDSQSNILEKNKDSKDWLYRLYSFGINFKSKGDNFSRVSLGRWGLTFNNGVNENKIIQHTDGLRIKGSLIPEEDNMYQLGAGNNRFNNLYVSTGTINTSDQRLKDDIAPLNKNYWRQRKTSI